MFYMTKQGRDGGRHVPLRTCVVCRQRFAKRELTRLVFTAGKLEIDKSGKLIGRGAYICQSIGCWGRAGGSDILDKALRVELGSENRNFIVNYKSELTPREIGTTE